MKRVLILIGVVLGLVGFLMAGEDSNTSSKLDAEQNRSATAPVKVKFIDYEKMKERIKDSNRTESVEG